MNGTIVVAALDPDNGERYEIDTRPGELGMYEGVVTGPFGTITGDPHALHELGQALLTAATSAKFAADLRVDELGPLRHVEPSRVDLSGQSTAQTAAFEGWINTVMVWGTAGDAMVPVEPGDWAGDDSGTAVALVDDFTDLHFADGRLYARSRCLHEHIHRKALAHPDHLAAVRREAEECPGDEDKENRTR
ncbi:hypothetical protein ABT039_22440 [Streptomyces lasiicapitis]|uniref:hypothetical protein n=1 Tax=Streptomyces lasiicapitis TaxID=1923961 RepID=UPI003319A137